MAQSKFFAMKFDGKTYDCGDKVGFLMANLVYGLEHPDTAERFRAEMEFFLKG
jgi:UTP--glucose-1-phosphate uridylyltransferase